MVLCAGLGTRLRPLSDILPKPAVPLLGQPLVRYALALLAGAGARRAVVNVHHQAEAMARAALEAGAALGLPVSVSREPVVAGTGGALREARALLGGAGEILLLNGDVLFDADLEGALAAHRRSGALATMVVAPMPAGASYAAVEVDGGGAVRRIAGVGPGGEGLTPLHFTGAHVLSPALLAAVPDEPFACDVNRQVYPPLLDGRVRAVLDRGAWMDLGDPAGYLAAHRGLLDGRVSWTRMPGADPFRGLAPVGPGIWRGAGVEVAAGATVAEPAALLAGARVEAGATVGPYAVVGRGARVGAGARVRDAVVWDGTEVTAGEVLAGAVAAGRLRVAAGGPARG